MTIVSFQEVCLFLVTFLSNFELISLCILLGSMCFHILCIYHSSSPFSQQGPSSLQSRPLWHDVLRFASLYFFLFPHHSMVIFQVEIHSTYFVFWMEIHFAYLNFAFIYAYA